MKGGIGGRLAIIFSLLVLVATATVGFLVFWGARQSLIESSTESLKHTGETIEVRFQASLEAIRKDVLFLAETPPVTGIVRAFAGPYLGAKDGGFWDEQTNHTDAEWHPLRSSKWAGACSWSSTATSTSEATTHAQEKKSGNCAEAETSPSPRPMSPTT